MGSQALQTLRIVRRKVNGQASQFVRRIHVGQCEARAVVARDRCLKGRQTMKPDKAGPTRNNLLSLVSDGDRNTDSGQADRIARRHRGYLLSFHLGLGGFALKSISPFSRHSSGASNERHYETEFQIHHDLAS